MSEGRFLGIIVAVLVVMTFTFFVIGIATLIPDVIIKWRAL